MHLKRQTCSMDATHDTHTHANRHTHAHTHTRTHTLKHTYRHLPHAPRRQACPMDATRDKHTHANTHTHTHTQTHLQASTSCTSEASMPHGCNVWLWLGALCPQRLCCVTFQEPFPLQLSLQQQKLVVRHSRRLSWRRAPSTVVSVGVCMCVLGCRCGCRCGCGCGCECGWVWVWVRMWVWASICVCVERKTV